MIKRLFDLFFSALGLIVLSPILLLVALYIKTDTKGPIFFRHLRIGLGGKVFKLHKFRSMYINSETHGNLTIGNDSRVTKSGKLLRKYKVDELPQLIDVFLGKMSLVGPRPEVAEYVDMYPDDVKKKILSVRPGITDMASIQMIDENQILQRHKNPKKAYVDKILPAKLELSIQYIDQRSIWLDLTIIFLTLKKIVMR
mgnify:CR=1 FL=1